MRRQVVCTTNSAYPSTLKKRVPENNNHEISREIAHMITNEDMRNHIVAYYHGNMFNSEISKKPVLHNKLRMELQTALASLENSSGGGGDDCESALDASSSHLSTSTSSSSINSISPSEHHSTRGKFTPLSSFLLSVDLLQKEQQQQQGNSSFDELKFLQQESPKLLRKSLPL